MIARKSKLRLGVLVCLVIGVLSPGTAAPGGRSTYQLSSVSLSTAGSAVVENDSVLILGEPLTGHGENAFFSLDVGTAAVLAVAGAEPVPGDADGDGDVDEVDLIYFIDCLFGPGVLPSPTLPGFTAEECLLIFDAQGDNDVDLEDFSNFVQAFTG